ncbi:hypothetical protein [Pseudosulfitobacter sp. DSM 107133]|uniref:hypothetical protein n=1 Tax=Pseudosulfitobacter sp. DSM 107133 TaxID=2883100 RepID=UPI000DF433DD|nr:hypothetical protein [Pseudosulfitobacter sp. DSM 107133]UOA29992.1 hypothetical protein DSM107133_04755 [Pseudosulfitobacter sp. DSM 107133]
MTCARHIPFLLLITAFAAAGPAHGCAPPERPFLPQTQDDMRTYADLIREDFDAYIADVQDYFRCVDEERARTFAEAREVSEDYGRFLNAVE